MSVARRCAGTRTTGADDAVSTTDARAESRSEMVNASLLEPRKNADVSTPDNRVVTSIRVDRTCSKDRRRTIWYGAGFRSVIYRY